MSIIDYLVALSTCSLRSGKMAGMLLPEWSFGFNCFADTPMDDKNDYMFSYCSDQNEKDCLCH